MDTEHCVLETGLRLELVLSNLSIYEVVTPPSGAPKPVSPLDTPLVSSSEVYLTSVITVYSCMF